MEYVVEMTVSAAPEAVMAALSDPKTWTRWQRGLAEVVPLPGSEAPARGARRELRFAIPGRDLATTETLLTAQPLRYDAIYETGPAWDLCENTLQPDGENTVWQQRHAWRFTDVEASEDDRERFEVTTRTTMDDLRRYVESGEPVPPLD